MLQAKNLSMRYEDTLALKDLSFTVASGEIFYLLGQNGTGKNTTINIFLGLVEPTSGEASLDNSSVRKNKYLPSKNFKIHI